MTIHCDEEVSGFRIPKLLLQPLVENAIMHGIEPLGREGKLKVSARLVSSFTESFTDQNAGRVAAEELMRQGADVLFAAAGGSGGTALQTAAQSGAWVIGVDQDEWLTTFADGQVQGADRLLTSAIKQVD